MTRSDKIELLEKYYRKYNQIGFIKDDPISIPHRFSKKQDIEISGFFAAIFSWGQRVTIINKCNSLLQLMDNEPYQFIMQHQSSDLKPFENFKHRTFNGTDALYFIAYLKDFYQSHKSLEEAFIEKGSTNMQAILTGFHEQFFALDYAPKRTQKHIATPARNSTCKRLNMFLRWMVRKDDQGVDIGIWENISTNILMMPLDVHVERSARKLGLIKRKQRDWKTVEELTQNLRKFDSVDPVRFDYALFGMGLEKY
ncbi:MAG: TIGR02757 family protein [Chitinophagales bacterium]